MSKLLTKFVIVFLAVGLLVGVVTTATSAQALLNIDVPITTTVFVPCANNGQGDTIQISGTLHTVLLITQENGVLTLHETLNGQGITGASTTTGAKYHTGIAETNTFHGNIGATQFTTTEPINLIFVGQGTASNLIEQFLLHFTVHPDLTVTAFVDNENVQCM
jgi:hypothetical protein